MRPQPGEVSRRTGTEKPSAGASVVANHAPTARVSMVLTMMVSLVRGKLPVPGVMLRRARGEAKEDGSGVGMAAPLLGADDAT